MNPPDHFHCYQIALQGHLDERWLRNFSGLEITLHPDGETIIRGDLDQAALHGIFNRIRDLGLEIVSVRRQRAETKNLPRGRIYEI